MSSEAITRNDLTAILNGVLPTKDTKTGTFTKAQSASTSYITVKQSGGVVYVGGFITGLTFTANTSATIGTISNVTMPTDAVRTICSVGANAYTMGTASYIAIATNGEVSITTSNAGSSKAVLFDICYIA